MTCGSYRLSLSKKELAILIGAGVLLSPLILVGALGYFTVTGGKKLLENHNGKRLRAGIRSFLKGLRKQIGRPEIIKAIAQLDEKIHSNPDDLDLYLQRATAKFLDMQFNGALADLRRVLQNEPYHLRALMLKAKIYMFVDRFDEANVLLDAALTVAPNVSAVEAGDVPTGFDRSDVLLNIVTNNLNKISASNTFVSSATEDLIQKCLTILEEIDYRSNIETQTRWNHLSALCYFFSYCQDETQNDKLKSAIKHLEAALIVEGDPEILSLLSQCYRLGGDIETADKRLQLARVMDPDVFVADATERRAMLVPWPRQRMLPDGAIVRDHHEFQQKTFKSPTYCEHCDKFIHGSWFRKDAECSVCSMRVHAECQNSVQRPCLQDPAN